MSDRLQQLRRQRALVAEHLAWLDREIEREPGGPTTPPAADEVTAVPFSLRTPPAAPPPTAPTAPAAKPRTEDSSATAAADAILRDYQVEERTMKSDVRKGCLLYFFAALALVVLGVGVLYFIFQSGK